MSTEVRNFRRQITFAEAAKISAVDEALKQPLTFDRQAIKLVQSPLYQRMGDAIEDKATEQQATRHETIERIHTIEQTAAASGLTKQDLEALIEAMNKRDEPMPQAGPQGPPGPPGPPGDQMQQGAHMMQIQAQIELLRQEQNQFMNHAKVAQEAHAAASANAARDVRAELVKIIDDKKPVPPPVQTVDPTFPQTFAPLPSGPSQPPPDNSEAIRLLVSATQNNSAALQQVAAQFNLSMDQITQLIQATGTARPQLINFAPNIDNRSVQQVLMQDNRSVTQGVQVTNISQPGRDRSQSKAPEEVAKPPPPPGPAAIKPARNIIPERSRTPEKARGRSPTRPKALPAPPKKPIPTSPPPLPPPNYSPSPEPVKKPPKIGKKPQIIEPDPIPRRPDSVPAPRYESPDRSRSRGRLPGPLERKVAAFDRRSQNAAHTRDLVYAFAGAYQQLQRAKKDAQIHEQKARRAQTADPVPKGNVSKLVQEIEAKASEPASELVPRIKKKVPLPPDGAFMSRQKTGPGTMIQIYRGT